ncbi:MAG: archaeosortase A [Candidatus Thalassarchaeaceae archaeon]|jgi:archaeosortase A (PGF-CTERM-specific)|nr:archaeosortase A [Euryarchaeota archaeon]MDP7256654.1 archaeosortase A [Candidatus Thalassarchaeaceae archaeon]MDP7446594.1 archaeosortase A [Candidatus Thalassarchaeaceae archaeon]MDP7649327.1 archaeosortase A [Candidatus Thalassarchaeaceae archaeon]HJL54867.1 archaeosortase A [Candidatus Thalassarchaeaceae archaeon]|tara:strand:- start:11216 stop:12199 length:984 start_codon:yes stop_codon:yes gene_type:complete
MEDPIGSVVNSLAESFGIAEVTMQLLIGATGLLLLGIGFHRSTESYSVRASIAGWPLIGLFFYLYSDHYVEIADPVLVLMTAGALPAGIGMSYWEARGEAVHSGTLHWLRGCVVWSMLPYYAVYSIPQLNMGFVYFTALSAEWMLEFSGIGGYAVGEMMVERFGHAPIPVSDWEGNRWILSEPLGEAGFFVPMNDSEGGNVVAFILACSAFQSMAVFIGAIVALSSVHWKRKLRALLIALPTIHVLNVFRNAGIVWLTDAYPSWSLFGMGMFDFAHSYAAKFASLFAMFLMAIALFDLLPELHRHIMRVLNPLMGALGPKQVPSDHS